MKRAINNPKGLTAADIAKLSPASRAQAEKALREIESSNAKSKEKYWLVSYFAPAVGRTVTHRDPIRADTKGGATSAVKSWIKHQRPHFRELKGATNFTAVPIQRNPARPFFCADCDDELKGNAVVMGDGRYVCARCAGHARQKRQDKSQRKLFEEQGALFSNPATLRNVEMGFVDRAGTFHPIRKSKDYNEFMGGDFDSPAEKQARSLKHQSKLMREYYAGEEKQARQRFEKQHKSLSQFVRSSGGIAYKPRAKGSRRDELRSKGGGATELGMLSPRETGTTGLLNQHNRMGSKRITAESMMDAANAEGYRDARGHEFDNIGDFISAVAGDASGNKKLFSNQDWESYQNPMKKAAKTNSARFPTDTLVSMLKDLFSPSESDSTVASWLLERTTASNARSLMKRIGRKWPKSIVVTGKRNSVNKPKKQAKVTCSKCGGAHEATYCNQPKKNLFGFGKAATKRRKAKKRYKAAKLRAKAEYLERNPKPKGEKTNPVRKSEFEFLVNTSKRGRVAGTIKARTAQAAATAVKKHYQQNGDQVKSVRAWKREAQKNPGVSEIAAGLSAALHGLELHKRLTQRPKRRRPTATTAGRRLAQRRHGHVSGKTKTIHRKVKNPNTPALQKLRTDFLGRAGTGKPMKLFVPPGAPKSNAALAKLTRIVLVNGREQRFTLGTAFLGGTEHGHTRRMRIGLKQPFAMPNGLNADKAYDYGEVKLIEYRARKPQLYGEASPEFNFYHHMGEEGGKRPHLILQNGCLAFKGGDYGIQREGIRN